MINSKLKAYKYDNGWESISRWDLLKLSKIAYDKFYDTYSPFYLYPSKNSPKLAFNRYQKTFRYLPKQGQKLEGDFKGMTISHQLAQEVLSDIRTMHLNLVDKRTKPYKREIRHTIEVDNIWQEHPLRVGNGRRADLLVRFSKPEKLALKWNGFFVLEVFVTHEVEGSKIIDFEKANIPLIQIELGRSLVNKKTASQTTHQEEEYLRRYMNNVFRKEIRGLICIDPSSTNYLENKTIQNLLKKIDKSNKENAQMIAENESSNQRINKLEGQLKNNRNHLDGVLELLRLEQQKTKVIGFSQELHIF